MHLLDAICRGGSYGTDKSAQPHSAHQFFPHEWAQATRCPGWGAPQHDARALADLMLRTDPDLPGLILQCHPLVQYAILQVAVPDYREFTDPGRFTADRIGDIPLMQTLAAERGSWKLVSGKSVIAEGVIRDGTEEGSDG